MENSHTHEVWLNKNQPDVDTQTAFKGTYIECFKYVDEIAKLDGCGAGLLLQNGNYDIVDLEEEAKIRVKKAAPELLKRLIDLVDWVESKEADEKPGFSLDRAKETIKKITE